MASTPEFLGPDGVYRTEFIFSTVIPNRFFTGRISSDTVDMQVSIRGAAFTSDPDLIVFEGTSFTIPNPAVYPDGLQLVAGSNRIDVRAISTTGATSSTSFIEARLSQEGDLGLLVQSPTGISLEKLDGTVRITVDGIDDDQVQGYNFYASTEEGGGADGYFQINPDLVNTGTRKERTSALGNLNVDAEVALTLGGDPAADPLYMTITGTQQDEDDTVIQTDFNEQLEVPEYVRKLRTEVTIQSVEDYYEYSFVHDRDADLTSENPALPNNSFAAIPVSDSLYYVVTAVYYDPVKQLEIETHFSPEVVGYPLIVSANIGAFPVVSRTQIVQETVLAIYRSQPQVRVDDGAVLRDTFIDPFSSEGERLGFILDFLHQAQSFSTLLPIDDPNLTGESVAVEDSTYKIALKQAFFLTEDEEVQFMIDQAFENIASKYGVFRRAGRRSRGESTFYTTKRPSNTIDIPVGSILSGGGISFQTTSTVQIISENIASFFSPVTGRYSVRVSIQAQDPGEAGNVAAGQITGTDNDLVGVFVINESPTFGGEDEESNRDLATRAMGRLSSVDTGTLQGYRQTAIDVPGVEEVKVVHAMSPLMQRDLDPDTGKHWGGKVDVWFSGDSVGTVSDNFAFSFEIAKNIQFEVVGSPQELIFRAIDPRLASNFPIIEMLDIPDWDYVFFNATKGYTFNLTDVDLIQYNAIQLSSSYNDPATVGVADVILGSYRYRTSDKYVFSRQPVQEIDSLVGSVTGEVTSTVYALYHPNSPLVLGRSVKAGNYLQVIDSEAEEEGITIPSGDPVAVTDETHVILGEYVEYLDNLGTNILTIEVWNEEKTVMYKGPFDLSGAADYTILAGSQTSPAGIKRTSTSTITSGETILVSYQHDENFAVTYNTNLLVQIVQEALDESYHLTADVLAKEAIENPVDIIATCVLVQGGKPAEVEPDIRTNLANYMEALNLGVALRQSDVITTMDDTNGVSFVVTPLTRMVRAEDAQVVREEVITEQSSDYTLLQDWSTTGVSVYLLNDGLSSATVNGGGPDNEFRGVFQSDVALTLQTAVPDAQGAPFNGRAGNAFIIGNDGLAITGFTDDATLVAEAPFTDPDQKLIWAEEERKLLTANRALISMGGGVIPITHEPTILVGLNVSFLDNSGIFRDTLKVYDSSTLTQYTEGTDYTILSGTLTTPSGLRRVESGVILSGQSLVVSYEYHAPTTLPEDFTYGVTYLVGEDSGVKNVDPGDIEFVTVGEVDLVFDEDR